MWRGSEKKKEKRRETVERSRQVSVRELRECAWKMDLGGCVLQENAREGACEGCV